MQSQKLCLKWNNHTPNLLSVLGSFQQKESLVDVTISCEGHNIKAHKIVLSACSPYFQDIFLDNPCQHPIIFMNGMKFEDIAAILNFMYKGEVNVSHDGLSSFLQAAEALKVKGLAEVCGEKNSTNSISQEVQQSEQSRPPRTDTPPRKRQRNRKRSLSDSNRSDDEGSTRKQHREPSSPEVHELSGDESFTGDNSSNGTPFNSTPRVPQKAFSRSHQPSSNLGDEDDYEMDADKLLEQNMTTETTSMNNSTDNNLRIERIMGNATEMESSSLQDPESPPDIKPIINFGESSTGASEGALMSYNEQSQFSQPGPSSAQDSTLLHDSSHNQETLPGVCTIDASRPGEEERVMYMCSECNYICGMLRVMRTHKRTCRGEKPSDQEDAASYQQIAKKKMYVCSDCDFSTMEESEMMLHDKTTCARGKISTGVQTEDRNLTSTPLVVMARPSSNVTEDPDAPERKTKESVGIQTDEIKFMPRRKDERLDCPHCSHSTTNKHNMRMHIKTHTGEKPYACDHCDKRFTMKSNLTTHIRTHTGQRPYVCDVCHKSFASKSVCDRHRIRWHTEERPFVCDICFMGFKFKLDLKNHKKTHRFG